MQIPTEKKKKIYIYIYIFLSVLNLLENSKSFYKMSAGNLPLVSSYVWLLREMKDKEKEKYMKYAILHICFVIFMGKKFLGAHLSKINCCSKVS